MFCTNCGRPTEGEQRLCPSCAAAQTQQQAPENDGFTLNTSGATGGKKKGKGGLIAAIAAGVLVLAAVLGIVFNLESIQSFFHRNLSSPKDYMISVEQEALTDYADILTNAYGQLTEAAADTGRSATGAQMHLLINEQLLALAEMGLTSENMDIDLGFLSDILLETEQYIDGDKICSNVSIGLGDKSVLTIAAIQDLASGIVYVGLPELTEQYLYAPMTEEERSVIMSGMTMMPAQLQDLPTQAAVEGLVEKYILLALSQIDQVEKDTVTLTAGGLEQKVTALTTTVYEKDCVEMVIAVLNAAKDEPELKKLIDAFSEYLNSVAAAEYGAYYEPMDLYSAFTAAIPELISELEQLAAEADPANYITWVTYVDNRDEVVGRTFTVSSVDEDEPMELLRYITVTQGDRLAFEGVLSELTVTGEGTKKNDLTNAAYTFSFDGNEIFRLEVQDLDSLKLEKENVLCGTFRLVPGASVMSSLLSGSGLPASALGNAIALELVLSDGFEFHILANNETLIGLTLASKALSAKEVALPASTADANDPDAVLQWLTALDFEALAENMTNAGVPATLVAYVNAYAELMVEYYG